MQIYWDNIFRLMVFIILMVILFRIPEILTTLNRGRPVGFDPGFPEYWEFIKVSIICLTILGVIRILHQK